MCTEDQHNEVIALLTRLEHATHHRETIHQTVSVSDYLSFMVDYRNRHYLYAWSSVALTMDAGSRGVFTIPADSWIQIAFAPGVQLVTKGQGVTPVQIILVCTDDAISSSSKSVTFANNNASVPSGAGNSIIKPSGGSITSISVTTTGSGAGNVQLFDNPTTNAGTVLFAFPATATAGTTYQINGYAKFGLVAQNVASGPVFTVFYS